jgi:hypothetical protein
MTRRELRPAGPRARSPFGLEEDEQLSSSGAAIEIRRRQGWHRIVGEEFKLLSGAPGPRAERRTAMFGCRFDAWWALPRSVIMVAMLPDRSLAGLTTADAGA